LKVCRSSTSETQRFNKIMHRTNHQRGKAPYRETRSQERWTGCRQVALWAAPGSAARAAALTAATGSCPTSIAYQAANRTAQGATVWHTAARPLRLDWLSRTRQHHMRAAVPRLHRNETSPALRCAYLVNHIHRRTQTGWQDRWPYHRLGWSAVTGTPEIPSSCRSVRAMALRPDR